MYGAINEAVLMRVPTNARRILDLGCGNGALGGVLREKSEAAVVGVTADPEEAAAAKRHLEHVIVADLDSWCPAEVGTFDTIIASHVLEHLKDPSRLLRDLARTTPASATLIIALPNVVYWRQRLEFLRGHFRYTSGGIMDATHLRFYDRDSASQLLEDSGWTVEDCTGTGGFPGSRWMGPLRKSMDALAVNMLPGVFSVQFVFVCRVRNRV